MNAFMTRQLDADDDASAEDFSADDDMLPARVVSPHDPDTRYPQVIHPTAIQPGGYAPHPHQILDPHHVARLMGVPTRTPPRWLTGFKDVFGHAADHHVLPAAGVLTLFGVSAWAHSEPYHPLIGGSIIAVGAMLARAGITAHRRHGADADPAMTKGLLGTGATFAFTGAVACAGLSPWSVLALALATGGSYVAWHQWQHHKTERARAFTVGITAAGNTGPTPLPPVAYSPGVLPVSHEESRLRAALIKIKAPEAEPVAIRRIDEDIWYSFVDLSDTDTTADKIEAQAEVLATRLGARQVEVERGNRPALVKITVYDGDDSLAETIPYGGDGVASVLDPIPLGRYEDGSRPQLSLAWKHTLVCGTTDMGKSGILNLILCKTMSCPDLVRILIDCKEGAPEFRAYKDVAFHVATDLDDAMRTLAGIEGIYRYRGRLLVEKDVAPEEDDETGETVQKWRAEFGPFILAAIDELTELTSNVPGAAKRIQSLRAKMRFVGLFALDATQFPARDTFGGTTTARMNYLNRISLPIAEQGGTNIIFGQGMHGRNWRPDMLDLPGKFLMYSPTVKRPRKARAERVEAADVARVVARWRDQVAQLDEGSAQAFWDAYHAALDDEESDGGGGGPRGGGKQCRESVEDAPAYGRPHLVIVPTFPDGSKIKEEHVRLWQLLGEFGSSGATREDLASRAAARGHQHASVSWVGYRLKEWQERGHVASQKEGREWRYWRTDLTADERRGGADDAAS